MRKGRPKRSWLSFILRRCAARSANPPSRVQGIVSTSRNASGPHVVHCDFRSASRHSNSAVESWTIPPPTPVSAPSARQEAADRARIDAPRAGFVVEKDLRRPDFRRAGDRRGRKGRAEDIEKADAGTQAAADFADHLMLGAVRFHMEELLRRDAAGRTDFRKVVADHVRDHQVFRAVLRIAGETPGGGAVFAEKRTALRRAFHRPRNNSPPVRFQEQLRREREDSHVFEMQERRAWNRMARKKIQEKTLRILRRRSLAAERQIRLIDFSRLDVALHVREAFAIDSLFDFRLQRKTRRRAVVVRDPHASRLFPVESEPDQRESVRRERLQFGVERRSGLVGDESRGERAVPQRRFEFAEDGFDFPDGARRQNSERVLKQRPAKAAFFVAHGRKSGSGAPQSFIKIMHEATSFHGAAGRDSASAGKGGRSRPANARGNPGEGISSERPSLRFGVLFMHGCGSWRRARNITPRIAFCNAADRENGVSSSVFASFLSTEACCKIRNIEKFDFRIKYFPLLRRYFHEKM